MCIIFDLILFTGSTKQTAGGAPQFALEYCNQYFTAGAILSSGKNVTEMLLYFRHPDSASAFTLLICFSASKNTK